MGNEKKIQIGRKKIVIRRSRKDRLKRRLQQFFDKNRRVLGIVVLAVFVLTAVILWVSSGSGEQEQVVDHQELVEVVKPELNFKYPEVLPLAANQYDYRYSTEVIPTTVSLELYLKGNLIERLQREELVFQAKLQDLDSLERGHTMYVFKPQEENAPPFFVYQISQDSLAVLALGNEPKVEIRQITLTSRIKEVAGIVKGDFFWDTYIYDRGEPRIAPQLAEALKWKVDFYHVHPDDRYKLIYEEKWYKNQLVEIGNLLAVYFRTKEKTYYAFRYESDQKVAYYDENGEIMRLRFLKSPVEYNIINSKFDLDRLHPVLKKRMPHLGTDYFARLNDPVYAVGQGKVEMVGTKSGNGNYVKIRHDETYQSQYLHLNKFAEGLKKGAEVKQGEVIGYAGKTGLATGVHVCFRFWVDDKQVNHVKEEVFQDATSLQRLGNDPGFIACRDSLKLTLDRMSYN